MQSSGNSALISELAAVMKREPILLYPSSGTDLNDILFFRRPRVPGVDESFNVFIHVDYYGFEINPNRTFDQWLRFHHMVIVSYYIHAEAGERKNNNAYTSFVGLKIQIISG